MSETTTIEGVLARVAYQSPDTGWSVVELDTEERGAVTATGALLGVQVGEQLRLTGRFETDQRFGEQFRVDSYLALVPSTKKGIERYLGSGVIDGIGPKMAKKLVAHFGEDVLDIIEKQPERLREAPGIGRVLAERITSGWGDQRAVKDVMIFLQGHGVSPALAARILRFYGDQTVAVLRTDPYRLAEEIHGIGFLTADRIAAEIGIAKDAPARLEAGILHSLRQASDDGHTFLPQAETLARAERLLGQDRAAIIHALDSLASASRIVQHQLDGGDAVFLSHLERAETQLAARLRSLARRAAPPLAIDLDRALADYEKRAGIALASAQRDAIGRAVREKILVITGGPGTGKTTLVRGIVDLLAGKGLKIQLAAPTGRAAKRLGEATGEAAKTIHRLLEFEPKEMRFQRDAETPLAGDVVIIDEASMLDTLLAHHLLEAVPAGARLVLVGDVDQLPSVGAGRVLSDIIDSGVVPVVRLETIFRQAKRSLIVDSAHRIRRGQLPSLGAGPEDDFFFIARGAPDKTLATLLELVTARIPGHFGLDPHADIQVLTPMQRGLLGAANLNVELQALLNPHGTSLARGSRILRVGDRVMQMRNNYDLEVFNGDIGRVDGIDKTKRQLLVTVDGRTVRFPFAVLDELSLAYACSIHKSQGSEFPCVVIALEAQHFIMLERNLLYTAVTRGKRLVVVVGNRRALRCAVERQTAHQRHTLLAPRLRAEVRPAAKPQPKR